MDYKDYLQSNNDHFWYKARRELIDYILKKYSKNKNCKILEIGCGTGNLIPIISTHGDYVGIEKNKNAYLEAQKYHKKIINKSIENLEITEKYDIICLFDVLEHIKDDHKAIEKVYSFLENSGIIIITIPAYNFLFSNHDIAMDHYRRYSKKNITKILRINKFKIIEMGYWNSLLFPIIAIIRIIKKVFSRTIKTKSFHSEIKTPPRIINKLIYNILKLENVLIKKNIKMPFGLSIYTIAKK